tara:strand:- start:190 stop:588 length:399 start_codon:yes stop_codon:yes gene_type:complete
MRYVLGLLSLVGCGEVDCYKHWEKMGVELDVSQDLDRTVFNAKIPKKAVTSVSLRVCSEKGCFSSISKDYSVDEKPDGWSKYIVLTHVADHTELGVADYEAHLESWSSICSETVLEDFVNFSISQELVDTGY